MADEKKPFRPMRTFSLCIDDVPPEAYYKHSNGKTYVNFTNEEKDPDNYGNDQTYYIQQTAEQRAAHAPKVFVGRGKTLGKKNTYTPQNTQGNTASSPASTPQPNAIPTNTNFDADKDLPF